MCAHEILELKNLHHIVVFYERRILPGFANRTFMSSIVWQNLLDAPLTFVLVAAPVERHDKVPPEQEAHAVRADGYRSLRLTRIGDNLTKLEFACSLDLNGRNGHFPRKLVNEIAIPATMRCGCVLDCHVVRCAARSTHCVLQGTLRAASVFPPDDAAK
jgi:hypothetical protein